MDARAIDRALYEAELPVSRSRVLGAYVEIMVAADRLADAKDAAAELADVASSLASPMLTAAAHRAAGWIRLAEDDSRGALADLRRASDGFRELETPYEAVAVRRPDQEGIWRVAASRVSIAPAERGGADHVELARLDGELTATIDGVESTAGSAPRGLLDLLAEMDGDAALTAERLDETTWVAHRWAL